MLINKTDSRNFTATSSVGGVEVAFVNSSVDQHGNYNFNIYVNDSNKFFENQKSVLKDTTEALHEVVAMASESYEENPPSPEIVDNSDYIDESESDSDETNITMAD